MADLTSAGTGAGGLGTAAARWALTATWGLGALSDIFGGSVAPPFGSELPALLLGLVSAVVLTTRGDDALPVGRGILVAVTAVLSSLGALASSAPLGHNWSFNFAAYATALLIPRGNVYCGLLGGASIGFLGVAWAISSGASAVQFVDLLALPLLALVIGTAWRGLLGRIVVRELTHDRETRRATMAAEAAEASAAATQEELAEIRAEVGATLSALSEGQALDDEFLARIAVIEADLRDRIRSPHLRDDALRAAIDRARRRGVRALLLGSSSQADVLSDALVGSIVEAIDGIDSGTVTLRAIPPGRHGTISLLRADDRTSERLVFDGDGRLLSRH
ncbi:MAG TPA: hypothetical protein PKE40_08085 [Arachnia sp.]|nr:hypothetical protein [Arachnia sp.]HMT86294.1 hypothetical protein [Arachnia sp.]